ncbi:Hypothetical predicted protein [Pelobates cultripes]|uniref:Uncharacterized protein n=1 Tax=Pelobates cultripes TaxID=61616 RepID=A0AAD1VYY4_PELCU|nr:Hypothetical predicted protein [Pelobates cultripes]
MADADPPSGAQRVGVGFTPARLTYWSLNIRGLNIPEKRSLLMRRLWAARASVVFLQEMHFRQGDAPKLGDKRYSIGFYANHPEAKKAGVAILFASTTQFHCTGLQADPQG